MPSDLSDYEETQLLAGTCGAQLRLTEHGAGMAYRAHPLPGDKPHYAPDRPANVQHIKLELMLDFDRKRISGSCETTMAAVNDGLESIEFDAVELEDLRNTKAIGDLERVAQRDLDGRVQRRAREAARSLREGADKGEEVKKLREELDDLQKVNRELRDRLDRLEARVGEGQPPGPWRLPK